MDLEETEMLTKMHKEGWKIKYDFLERNNLTNWIKVSATKDGHTWTTAFKTI